MKYSLIYADPAWEYGNTISNGAASNHYGTMKLIDMKRLPVWELAEAWGFRVRTMKGFTWVKFNTLAEEHINRALQRGEVCDFYDFLDLLNAQTKMNGGNYTRANTEDLLIAVKGKGLMRQNASVKQVIYSPLGKHSAKPEEARYKLEQLYGDVPRIELFSRCGAPGWHHWGNESASPDVELLPAWAAPKLTYRESSL